MPPDEKKDNTVTADIPESVFEEALRAVEKIQSETREAKKKETKAPPEDDIEIEIQEDTEEDLQDLISLIDTDADKAGAAKKQKPKASSSESDLAVLTRLLEEEYNLEKEAEFFKNVLFDSLKEEPGKVDQSLLDEKEEQIQALLERLNQIQTEFEKFRQRIKKEAETAKKYSNESLMLQILPILDNLDRAIEHSDRSTEKGAMVQGVRLVYKQLLDTLVAVGVQPFEALGKAFDPSYHDAMVAIETDEVEPNLVVSEYQKGYLLFDRLLRPAKVVVSKRPETGDNEAKPEANEEKTEEIDEK